MYVLWIIVAVLRINIFKTIHLQVNPQIITAHHTLGLPVSYLIQKTQANFADVCITFIQTLQKGTEGGRGGREGSREGGREGGRDQGREGG